MRSGAGGARGAVTSGQPGLSRRGGLFNSAINALIAEPMQTDAERDLVKRQANTLQEGVDAAKEYAKVVCPLSEEPTAGGSAAGSNETDYDFAAKRDLQQAATTATSQYSEAARLYEAHDRAGACASARLSATSFARVVAALKAQPALESALANVAQLYANAAQAAEDRDTFYCTG